MTTLIDLENIINRLWEQRTTLSDDDKKAARGASRETLALMDTGNVRVAEKKDGTWHVNQWVKKALLLFFSTSDNMVMPGGPNGTSWFDKMPMRFENMGESEFRKAGFRAVPGCFVRHSAYIAPRVVLMPSFVNAGAYVDEGTMVDTWATIGSCAQIGKNCHISGGTGIGGVMEPVQANPVIIEDNVFIGARSEVAEGVIVETGSVISMGVFLGASTKIIDRESGEVFQGRVRAYSVVVPGTLPGKNLPDGSPGPGLACAVIVKRVDEKTRSKTSINELLRA